MAPNIYRNDPKVSIKDRLNGGQGSWEVLSKQCIITEEYMHCKLTLPT